jgi:hypothetical protein
MMSRKKYPTPEPEEEHDFDLKVCSVTKALSVASEWICKNKDFKITFVNKKDESTHVIEHSCHPMEYKIDDHGQKWKKVYE